MRSKAKYADIYTLADILAKICRHISLQVVYRAAVLEYAADNDWSAGGAALLMRNTQAYVRYAELAKEEVRS